MLSQLIAPERGRAGLSVGLTVSHASYGPLLKLLRGEVVGTPGGATIWSMRPTAQCPVWVKASVKKSTYVVYMGLYRLCRDLQIIPQTCSMK